MNKENDVKKYELTDDVMVYRDHILHRIRALKDFGDVKAGDLGGWVESEANLSQAHVSDCDCSGCWIYDKAIVYGDAKVSENATIHDSAEVYGNVCVCDDAKVCDSAEVYGNARIGGHASIHDHAKIDGNACVYDNARVGGYALVYEHAKIGDYSQVHGNVIISGNAEIYGHSLIGGKAHISAEAYTLSSADYLCFDGFGPDHESITFFKCNEGTILTVCNGFDGHFILEDFCRKIEKEYKGGLYQKEYRAAVDVAKIHFGITNNKKNNL